MGAWVLINDRWYNKELNRRAALAKFGAFAGTAYMVPSVTTMSAAFASSDSSDTSDTSDVSDISDVSDSSPASPVSRPSSATGDPAVDACTDATTTDEEFTQCLIDAGIDPETI